ncbi:hypothetical protein M5689_004374 [Euphorbia peplus]|nr:hypothetical protein M5689_004374 [Euphorbia peplus]
MCYSCDNPCQPFPSPPVLPPPPPSAIPECPPPPLPSPPPAQPEYLPPPAPVEECSACPPVPTTPIPEQQPPTPPYVTPGNGQFYSPPGPGLGDYPVPYFPNSNTSPSSSAFSSVYLELPMILFPVFFHLMFLCQVGHRYFIHTY